ncbi:ribbon-helix-helix domain-containing protein [Rhodobacter capsulatus]|uniref:ribbon-helix-helix domain-containing protein n=1 Tax=Rhodobacter capsulatus TaxID=1061 RepID=UPI004027E6D3
MCELFIKADAGQWQSRTHSLRIDGVATSIRIETHFWDTLTEIGQRDGMTTAQLITKLWHEAMDADHDLGNFTSFLRVCCALSCTDRRGRNIPRPPGADLGASGPHDPGTRGRAAAAGAELSGLAQSCQRPGTAEHKTGSGALVQCARSLMAATAAYSIHRRASDVRPR